MNDVNSQKHYTSLPLQHIEFAQRNNLNWCQGNITKYVCRYKYKNGVEDLLKAKSYLNTLIYFEMTGKFLTPDQINEELLNYHINDYYREKEKKSKSTNIKNKPDIIEG